MAFQAASRCSVCGVTPVEPLYHSRGHASMTTMCRLYDQPTEVFFCGRCGHLQTNEIVDIDDYYAHQYEILAESAEEDQLYQVVDGRRVFQVEHRIETLLARVPLPPHARVLDFGCAKGAVLRRLLQSRPDVQPFLFDVTTRYLPFWNEWTTADHGATGVLPEDWRGTMDVVCSFYVLEHVAEPKAVVDELASLLKPGGTLYFLVPNVLANTADFIVADHLQHYSESSLLWLLHAAGLEDIRVDDRAHRAAFVVSARRGTSSPPTNAAAATTAPLPSPHYLPPDLLRAQYQSMSAFWSQLAERITRFEQEHRPRLAAGRQACIYGAGFYGNFIASCLRHPETISCFVDQNPFVQGRSLLGKPIVPPTDVGRDVTCVYVGLNPAIARSVIAEIPAWTDRQFDAFFL